MPRLTLNGHDLSGTTSHRPVNVEAGQIYFDTDLGALIVWSGSAWVYADGTAA